jgi:murein DD-endopeptidase MepM/ murein hydrolase activator NlpD
MNIIFVRKTKTGLGHTTLTRGLAILLSFFLLAVVPAIAVGVGYFIGTQRGTVPPGAMYDSLRSELAVQRDKVNDAAQIARDNVNALALKLGQLQAQAIRLDALGDRLTKMANLDKGEFDFKNSPAVGGPETKEAAQPISVPDFLVALENLSTQLDNRSQQLGVLETLLMNRQLQAQVTPAGRPIEFGWISSHFGIRTDPFRGGQEHHGGIDFASKYGAPIKTVASGVVTFAGHRSGYGNLVEINHGNGYATRYGHCAEILVAAGDLVKKGQEVALVGSTGRSTGPHVHFEVVRNGRIVNPREYVEAKPSELFGS